jgi:hypothetical protein
MKIIGLNATAVPQAITTIATAYSNVTSGTFGPLYRGVALPTGSTVPSDSKLEGFSGTTAFATYRSRTIYRIGRDQVGLFSLSANAPCSYGYSSNHIDWSLWNENVEYGLELRIHILSAISLTEDDYITTAAYLSDSVSYRSDVAISGSQRYLGWSNSGTPDALPAGSGWTGNPGGYTAHYIRLLVNPRRPGMIGVRLNPAICPWTANFHNLTPGFTTVYVCPKIDVIAAT